MGKLKKDKHHWKFSGHSCSSVDTFFKWDESISIEDAEHFLKTMVASKLNPSHCRSDSPIQAFHLSNEVREGDFARYTAEHENCALGAHRLKVEELSLTSSKGHQLDSEYIHVLEFCWKNYAMIVEPSILASPEIVFDVGHGFELVTNTLVTWNRCYLLAIFIGRLYIVLLHRQIEVKVYKI